MEHVVHPIAPVFDSASRVLILGTMPSPASRAQAFYYMHPQNRFWPVMAAVFAEELPQGAEARARFALAHRFALWDVLASCDIRGASDSSIRNPLPNDIAGLLGKTGIRTVFTTGKTSFSLYRKYCLPETRIPAQLLPSSSPANCRLSTADLIAAYRAVRTAVEQP